jgi:hypothetical protein
MRSKSNGGESETSLIDFFTFLALLQPSQYPVVVVVPRSYWILYVAKGRVNNAWAL